jgi:HPt (histidine-containing phosphotransfer) domain-containing protein
MSLPSPDSYLDVKVDEDILDMIDGFLKNQRLEVAKLRTAIGEKDMEKARRIGHSMKGVGGMYGFDWITLIAIEIQTAAKENPALLPDLVEQLDKYLLQVRYRAG